MSENAIGKAKRGVPKKQPSRYLPVFVVLLALGTGMYVSAISSWFHHSEALRLVLLAVPALVSLILVFTEQADRLLFYTLLFCLPFSARFRVLPDLGEFHFGGAEAALAPIDFPLVALLMLELLRALRNQTWRVRWSHLDTLFAFFIAVNALSLLNSQEPLLTTLEVLRLVKLWLLLRLTILHIRRYHDIGLILLILLGSMAFQSLLGIGEALLNRTFGLGFLGEQDELLIAYQRAGLITRIGGTLGHTQALANYLALLVPVATSLLFVRLPRYLWFALAGAVALGVLAMLLTYSRAGWASLAGGLFLVLFLHLLRTKQKRRLIPVLLLLVTVVALLLVAFRAPIISRLTGTSQFSVTFRVKLIQIALNMIEDHPLVGVGANSFVEVMESYNDVELPHYIIYPVHNIYFLLMSETGLLGLLAFLLLMGYAFRDVWRLSQTGSELGAALAIGIGAGLATILVQNMLDWGLRYDVVYSILWFQIALLAAVVWADRQAATKVLTAEMAL